MNLTQIADHLTEARKTQGLTLREVAERMNVSVAHLWRLEHHEVPGVPATMLECWAAALGKKLNYETKKSREIGNAAA